MILQKIWRRIVSNIVIHISPSNIFLTLLLPERSQQNCQAAIIFSIVTLELGMILQTNEGELLVIF